MTPQQPRIWLRVLFPFAFGYFLSYLFRVVNAVIAPNLVADLGLDPARLGLLTSAYFLSFAAFQLPLGLLLDRYGPRHVEAILLLFAAAGALIFATAEGMAALVVGRALIGLGVSACLMAAFKAFVLWFPAHRLPFINGLQMVAGGLGAISATTPVVWLLQITDWRGLFILLTIMSLLAALIVFLLVPGRPPATVVLDPKQQLRGLLDIFKSRFFWRIAPWTLVSQAAFLAIQGLWSGPWLRDVAGLDRSAAAQVLLVIAVSMVAGFFGFGALAERLGRRGVTLLSVAAGGMLVFMFAQLLLIVVGDSFTISVWMLFGFCGTAGILPYAALSHHFGPQLSGRANTGLNLLVFIAAFAAQWGIGAVISLWPATGSGYAAAGYHAGFGLMLALQSCGCVWFVIAGRKRGENQGPSAGRPLKVGDPA